MNCTNAEDSPICLIWCIWKENKTTFEDYEWMMKELGFFFFINTLAYSIDFNELRMLFPLKKMNQAC